MTRCCPKRSNLFEAYEPDEIVEHEHEFRGRPKWAGSLQNGRSRAFTEIRRDGTTRVAGASTTIGSTLAKTGCERDSSDPHEFATAKICSRRSKTDGAGRDNRVGPAGRGMCECEQRSDELVSPRHPTGSQPVCGKANLFDARARRAVARRSQAGAKRFERLRPANCAGQTGNETRRAEADSSAFVEAGIDRFSLEPIDSAFFQFGTRPRLSDRHARCQHSTTSR